MDLKFINKYSNELECRLISFYGVIFKFKFVKTEQLMMWAPSNHLYITICENNSSVDNGGCFLCFWPRFVPASGIRRPFDAVYLRFVLRHK